MKGKMIGDWLWLGMDGFVMVLFVFCFIVFIIGVGGGGIYECGSDNVGFLEGVEDEFIIRRERRMREGRFVGLLIVFLVFIVGVFLVIV